MNWFAIALIGPLFWAISNHLDKIVLNRYSQNWGIGSIALLVALVDSLFIPVAFFFGPQVFAFPPIHIALLITFGAISILNLMIYFHVLNGEDTSTVVPLFQLIPVFTYFLSFVFLHEVLSGKQIIASLIIIFGSLVLSLDISEKIPKIKSRVLILMTVSSLIIAGGAVVFKTIALKESFWGSSFWGFVGSGLMGLFLFSFVKSSRVTFLRMLSSSQLSFINLTAFSEIVTVIANLAVRFATLLTSVTLVWVVNGFQPAFVFFIGLFLTLFFPHLSKESLLKRHLFQKIFSIGTIFAGTYLLNS